MPARNELEKRKKSWKPREMIFTSGALAKFARLVGAAKDGAVTHGSAGACGHLGARPRNGKWLDAGRRV